MKLPVTEETLSRELAKQGYEMINAIPQKEGIIEVQATILHPVSLSNNELLHIPVPVTLQVKMSKKNNIETIDGGSPTAEMTNDAEHFVKTLAANNQIEGLPGKQASHPTHRIEVNEKGQSVIKRSGFTLF